MLDKVFADLALAFSEAAGAPYIAVTAVWTGTPTYDTGGSITAAGTAIELSCRAQFDSPSEAMRQAEGFRETDARIIVLASSLAGTLDTKARIVVGAGANAGTWELLSVVRDPAGIGYECRGRLV